MSIIHQTIQILLKSPKFLGRDYLIENLPKWFLKNPSAKEVVSTFGFKIQINPLFDKNIEKVIYDRGVYELGTLSILDKILDQKDTFIDVGANIGFLSLFACTKVGSNGQIIAFEPVSETRHILQINKNLNQFSQLKIMDCALGNTTELKKIYSESENRGGASILNHKNEKGELIKIKKLDDFDLKESIKAIKVDVEGYELEVLKGAKKTIKNNRPNLIIEYTSTIKGATKNNELYEWIRNLNLYNIYKLKYGKDRPSKLIEIKTVYDLPKHDNIFCFPKKVLQ